MRTVTFKADDALFESIEDRAVAEGSSISEVIRRALESELEGGIQQQILQLQIVLLGTLLTMPEVDKKDAHNAIEHVAKNLNSFVSLAVISDEENTE